MATTQKAIVLQGGNEVKVVTDRPLPKLRDGYLLVKTVAVALNPTDWKSVDRSNTKGHLLGCDYAGIVQEVSEHGLTKKWQKGDRVYGMAHGANNSQAEDGAFAEFILVKGDIAMRIPDNLSFEKAATLGVGIFTVGQGLYQYLQLELPDTPAQEAKPILIYGGSTATGTLGIQFAKLSGYKPITTCSPSNFDLVKQLGAEAAFDYRASDCGAKIREYTDNNLKLAWDTIGLQPAAQVCADALSSSSDCKYGSIIGNTFPRDDIQTFYTLAYTVYGEFFHKLGKDFPANAEDFNYAKMWALVCERLLAEGKIQVHPPKVSKAGLDGVLDGLDLLRKDQVSGEKLVYVL